MKQKEVPIFAIAADNWRNDVLILSKYKTYVIRNGMLKYLNAEFGHRKINTITKQDIQKFITKYSQKMGGNALRTYLATLRDVIEYSDENWEMPRRLKFPKNATPKRPFYSFEDVRKLLQKSNGDTRALIMLMAETGCRFGEATALDGGDLDGNAIRIHKNVIDGMVQDSPKTESSNRKVNITETLASELQTLAKNKGFLFRTPTGRPTWPQKFAITLQKICKHAEVDYRPSHAFRRGNVRELILNLHIPERVVGARIGHKSSDNLLLGVYCQTQDDDDLRYVNQIESWLYRGEQ